MVYFVRIISSASNYMYMLALWVNDDEEQKQIRSEYYHFEKKTYNCSCNDHNNYNIFGRECMCDAKIILAAFSDNDNKKMTLILSFRMISVDSVCVL